MIEVERIRTLNVRIQGQDIDNFISIMEKLLVASKQSGFKKPFTVEERATILGVADSLELDKPREVNINSNKIMGNLNNTSTKDLEKELSKRKDRNLGRCPKCRGKWPIIMSRSRSWAEEPHCFGCRKIIESCTC